jgi:hypothetical protein
MTSRAIRFGPSGAIHVKTPSSFTIIACLEQVGYIMMRVVFLKGIWHLAGETFVLKGREGRFPMGAS